jgi:hypothetical protein
MTAESCHQQLFILLDSVQEKGIYMRSICLTVVTLFMISGSALADTAILKNGREIHGRMIRETKTFIEMRIAQGGRIRIRKVDIATFTENDNFGFDYGQGGKAKKPVNTGEKESDAKAEKPSTPKEDAQPKSEKELFKETLPKASKRLNEKQQKKLLDKLFELRAPKLAFLPGTKPSAKESQEIKALFKTMGYSRKAGNRGVRDQAVAKLAAYGVKVLPGVAAGMDDSNVWRRRNTLRLIAKIAKNDDAWAFYNSHFKISQKLISLVVDQSDELSFSVRSAANTSLTKLSGKSVKFIENSDQFRTRGQVTARDKWELLFAKRADVYKASEAERAGKYKKLLKDWRGSSDEEP